MRLRLCVVGALCVMALACPTVEIVSLGARTAHASPQDEDSVEKRLAAGRELFQDQEYRRAIRALSPLVREPAVTRTQRVQAFEIIGLSQIILGQERRAEEAFWGLLEIDPRHELSEDFGSDKIRGVFQRVKAAYFPARLRHEAPARAVAGEPLALQVEVDQRAELVNDVVVMARPRGHADFHATRLTTRNRLLWRGQTVPPPAHEAYVLEYYIEGHDSGGRLVALLGAPRSPFALPTDPGEPPDRPWYRRWYVIAGGAALVGISAIVLLSGTSD